MLMDTDRVDKILQYALLVARKQDDYRDQQLGPIHLIKYVYLADLAYAEVHNGQTFTGVKWQFYNFGPWTQEVNGRIEPALSNINAIKKSFPSDYENKEEWHRWTALPDTPISKIEEELPLVIAATLQKQVHRFGQETPELLAYVYSTKPMRYAAPNELLDFSVLESKETKQTQEPEAKEPLSKKKRKELKEKMHGLKKLSKEKLATRRKTSLVKPPITPRYDDLYYEGLEWLDSLAGDKLPEGEKEVAFSDSIWKSPTRRGDDFSQ